MKQPIFANPEYLINIQPFGELSQVVELIPTMNDVAESNITKKLRCLEYVPI